MQFDPLSAGGAPRCPQCGNHAPRVLAKKKRGVKVMFVPVYKGSAGHVSICTLCSNVSPVSDESARIMLQRYMGSEYTRLYMSRHMQTAEGRIAAARVLMEYTSGPDLERDLRTMVTPEMSEDLVNIRVKHCMSWRLSQALGISMADAEEVIYEDMFSPVSYVDEDLQILVDPDDVNLRIEHARRQAATG